MLVLTRKTGELVEIGSDIRSDGYGNRRESRAVRNRSPPAYLGLPSRGETKNRGTHKVRS